MTQKSRPRSSSRSYSSCGIIAVARSSVFLVGRNQKASWPIRRRRRSATDMLSEFGMRALAMSSASTAVSPPMRRNSWRMSGLNSAQCPSASMIGCFRRPRICRASVCAWVDMPVLRGEALPVDDTPALQRFDLHLAPLDDAAGRVLGAVPELQGEGALRVLTVLNVDGLDTVQHDGKLRALGRDLVGVPLAAGLGHR